MAYEGLANRKATKEAVIRFTISSPYILKFIETPYDR